VQTLSFVLFFSEVIGRFPICSTYASPDIGENPVGEHPTPTHKQNCALRMCFLIFVSMSEILRLAK